MNILLITFEFPPGQGGTGTYAFQMARGLHEAGHKITVLAHSPGADLEEARAFDGSLNFEVRRYPTSGSKLLRIWHRIRVSWNAFGSGSFDVVFIPFPNAAVLGWAFKALRGTPYVLVGHGSEFTSRNPLRRLALKQAYRRAAAAAINSRFTRRLMEERGFTTPRVRVISLGADEKAYDPAHADAQALRTARRWQDRRILLTVGGLRPVKGHGVVLEALEQLVPEFPNLLYLVVGTGREKSRLEEAVKRRGLENHVRFEGMAAWEQLRDYYAMCEVFVLNSNFESFGIVLVEAALMGKPAVATSVGGIPDVVDHGRTGLLVPPQDARATAQALERLLRNPEEARALGEGARSRALQELTWSHTVRETEALLGQAAGHRSAQGTGDD